MAKPKTKRHPFTSPCHLFGLFVLLKLSSTINHRMGNSVIFHPVPDSKVHGANMGPTWVLSAPDEPHVGPMNLAIWGSLQNSLWLHDHCFMIIKCRYHLWHSEWTQQNKPMWTSDAIWRHIFGSSLAQVIICCLTGTGNTYLCRHGI